MLCTVDRTTHIRRLQQRSPLFCIDQEGGIVWDCSADCPAGGENGRTPTGNGTTGTARVNTGLGPVYVGLDPFRTDVKPPTEWSAISLAIWTHRDLHRSVTPRGLVRGESPPPEKIWSSKNVADGLAALHEAARRASLTIQTCNPRKLRESVGRFFGPRTELEPRDDPRFSHAREFSTSPKAKDGVVPDPYDTDRYITTIAVRFGRKETKSRVLEAAFTCIAALASSLHQDGHVCDDCTNLDVSWHDILSADEKLLESLLTV